MWRLKIIPCLLALVLFPATLSFGKTIAQVNGQSISNQEFEEWVKSSFRIGYRLQILQKYELKKHILKMYCVEKALLDKASKIGTYASPEEINAEINSMKEAFRRRTEGKIPFSRLLLERKITMEGLRHRVKVMLSVRKAVEKQTTEKKLKEYFKKYKRYFGGERVRARHILILTMNKVTKEPYPRHKQKRALKRIRKIQKKIDPDGKNFGEIAKEYSESPSGKRGGDVGFFPIKGRMPESFTHTAFKLKVGEVSGIVQTPYGYHIIQVTDRKKPKNVTFEAVRSQVKQEYIRDHTEEFVQKVKKEANISMRL